MDNTIIAALIGAIGGLIGAWIGGVISRKASIEAVESSNKNAINIMQRQEFFSASSKFKSAILYELSGFYPIDQNWNENDFPRIYESIPKISSAATEFRYFVTRKTEFDRTVSAYNKYCRETTYESIAAYTMFPSMKKERDIGKREEFKNIVEHLLSFADEK
ncbi:MAG: hypothetical protein HRU72_04480 [Planctomycetia bacterium]|nr:MAG: hypothetical protein HRU72_04480 [Planctomycetia bacterium]TVL96835.1 MAG: hypothetical protein CV082_05855 [Candidatus Brocadia sp. BL1]HQU32304.1 hypothetical protein [Candidatus Brocadia sapporoensis]